MLKRILAIICAFIIGLCLSCVAYADNRIHIVVWSFSNELMNMIEKYYSPNHPEVEFEYDICPTDGNMYTIRLDIIFENNPASMEAPDIFALDAACIQKRS